MSAIAGIVRTDMAPVPPDSADRLCHGLRHRAPGGLRIARTPGIFLACAQTNSGSFWQHRNLQLIGDVRLDNRDDLAHALRLSPQQRDDGEIVIAALSKWGPNVVARFVGDFAFALWDADARSICCARDNFGVRPLYYRVDAEGFAFASEEKALGGTVDAPLTERFVATFLAGVAEATDETGHPGIRRLDPAHWLVWHRGRVTTQRYWTLEPDNVPADNAIEGFRDRFQRAVGDRMRGPGRVAAMLSGGLDSSSIAVEAASHAGDVPLGTYSMVYRHSPEFDETPFIDSVLHQARFHSNRIACDGYAPLNGIERMFAQQDGLYYAPALAKSHGLYVTAAGDGVAIMLDGHGGDEVVWSGAGRLIELASRGRWLRVFLELDGYCRVHGEDRAELLAALFLTFGPRGRPFGRLRQGAAARLAARREAGVAAWQRLLVPAFVGRTDLVQRLAAQGSKTRSDRAQQHRAMSSPRIGQAFEVLDKASAAAGVEARYPFFDVRLATYCLGLPTGEKLRNGEGRSILRRAMKGVLPETVRRRTAKTNFRAELAVGLVRHHRDVLSAMVADRDGLLAPFIEPTALARRIDDLTADPAAVDGDTLFFLWRAACLYLWQAGSPTRRVVPC